jgi:hypothetical protein
VKNKANKGFIKELSKAPKSPKAERSSFSYSDPVVTPKRIKSVAFKANSRDKKTSADSDLVTEQSKHLSRKGSLNGKQS